VLIDVSAKAREAGFKYPVALTIAAWVKCVAVPPGVVCQDKAGRLWDVLTMPRLPSERSPEAPRRLPHSASGSRYRAGPWKTSLWCQARNCAAGRWFRRRTAAGGEERFLPPRGEPVAYLPRTALTAKSMARTRRGASHGPAAASRGRRPA
jgi:hypothetical protein